MYGTVIIKTASAQAQFKTWAHDSIYAFLTDHGYAFDGEPSAPIPDNVIVEFVPERDTWPF